MDTKQLLDQLLKAGQELATRGRTAAEERLGVPQAGAERDAMLSGMGKGALAAGALALLLGTNAGRRLGGTALKLGGLTALGGLAYKAYQNWQVAQGGSAPTPSKPLGELTGPAADRRSRGLIRAMVAAAKADGHIDAAERDKIKQQLQRFGLDSETLGLLQAELDKPLDPKDIAAAADSPEAASEIYPASLLVIDVDNPMERAYLQELAAALKLPAELVAQIEAEANR